MFEVASGARERIPLLIGTASSTPRLGYTIPAGTWGIQATLTLGNYPSDPYLQAHTRPPAYRHRLNG